MTKQPAYPGFSTAEKVCRRDGCDKRFKPTAPADAYCSEDCKGEAIRAQRRRTDKGKRERARKRQKANGGPITRKCALEGCDREFKPETPRASYCSSAHRAEATRIIKARNRAKARGEKLPEMPTSATQQAIQQIDAAFEATGGEEVGLSTAEYVTHLWKRVNEDPDCPPHVYDRLERLLGVPPDEASTMPGDATGD